MSFPPITQPSTPPTAASPIASNGRFSQNTLLIAGVASTVASIALAIFEMITWTTAASVVTSLAVCYAISYFLSEGDGTPAPATNPPSGTTAAPTPRSPDLSSAQPVTIPQTIAQLTVPPADTTQRSPDLSSAQSSTILEIIGRATGTPQRLNFSLLDTPAESSDDDDGLDFTANNTSFDAANTSQLMYPHSPENSPPQSPTQGRSSAHRSSTPLTAPSTPPHVGRVKRAVRELSKGFPSPAHSQQPTDHTIWRREIVALYETYVTLLHQIEAFLAPGAPPAPPVQTNGDRRQAANVLKQTLQYKERDILDKLREKRTFLSREDYRRHTSELQVDVQQIKARLDRA